MMNYNVITRSAKLSYDVCEKCGSLWLDRGELDKMAFQVTGSIEFCSEEEADVAARPRRTCPRCDDVQSHRFDSLVKAMSFWITAGIAAGSGSMAMS
jgi:Zn-finger nucleic acid-binding protein